MIINYSQIKTNIFVWSTYLSNLNVYIELHNAIQMLNDDTGLLFVMIIEFEFSNENISGLVLSIAI